MQELIKEVLKKVPYDHITLDGLYQSDVMMDFLDGHGIKFLMRLPRNRTVRISEEAPAFKIGNHRGYRLQRNQRTKVYKGFLNGKIRYIVAEKRKNCAGVYETVFLISNFEKSAKEYLSIYLLRWNIEQLFRASKQSLGLGDCQAIYLKRQRLHIFSVFVAFAIADSIKYLSSYSSTEDGIRYLKNFILGTPPRSEYPANEVSYAIA
jgi:hypothetical protein